MGAQAVRLSNVDIDNALKNKDFEVLFQPIFDLGSGALARMETFVRWRHKTLGLLPPGAFISFFETQGRMSELTRYVLAEALGAYLDWRGSNPPGFSINLALSDLSDDAFAAHFSKLLRDREFPAELVTLECPMPPVDTEVETAAAHFKTLKATGARLAIEVRGRANDLLRTIEPFPFDEIKTGGSAILRFARTVRGPGLSAIADLLDIANNAGAAITAVGVEDQASLAALRGLGFTAAQGNHLAKVGELKEFKPAHVNEVRRLLGLTPLDKESLLALFRATGPAPAPSPPPPPFEEAETPDAQPESAALPAAEPAEDAAEVAQGSPDADDQLSAEEDRKAKAREKAKALALAKRAKTRDARKTAAIERAKSRAAEARGEADDEADPFAQSQAPRDLQKRLNEEFAPADDPEETEEEKTSADAPPSPDDAPASDGPLFEQPPQQRAAVETSPEKPKAEPPETAPSPPEPEPVPEKAASPTPAARKAAPAQPKPEKPEAPKTAAPPAAPAQKKQTAPAAVSTAQTPEAPIEAISMSVGGAKASFRPELRLSGNRAFINDERALTRPQAPEPPRAAPPRPPVEDNPPEIAFAPEEETAAEETTPTAPEVAAELVPETAQPSLLEVNGEDIVQGDLHRDLREESVETDDAPRRKRKNFLTRKYRLMPTHFWPKSWKRRYKRMTGKQGQPRTAPVLEEAALTE